MHDHVLISHVTVFIAIAILVIKGKHFTLSDITNSGKYLG